MGEARAQTSAPFLSPPSAFCRLKTRLSSLPQERLRGDRADRSSLGSGVASSISSGGANSSEAAKPNRTSCAVRLQDASPSSVLFRRQRHQACLDAERGQAGDQQMGQITGQRSPAGTSDQLRPSVPPDKPRSGRQAARRSTACQTELKIRPLDAAYSSTLSLPLLLSAGSLEARIYPAKYAVFCQIAPGPPRFSTMRILTAQTPFRTRRLDRR